MKRWYIGAACLLFLLIVGCGGQMNSGSNDNDTNADNEGMWEQSITGYVADKEDSRILLIGKITKQQSEEMNVKELLEKASPEAYWLEVSDVDQYEIGQKLEVWPKGPMMESYPAQGAAGKINILEDNK